MGRTYSSEFIKDALKYVETHKDRMDYTQMANNMGVPYGTLYGWVKKERKKKKLQQVESDVTPDSLEDAKKEIEFLKRELRDTQDALIVLKKAISILND